MAASPLLPTLSTAFLALTLAVPTAAQSQELHKFSASDADGGDQYGHSVGVDGDTVVIGAAMDEAVAFFGGSAYVMVRDGAGWVEQAKLTSAFTTMSDRYGWAVDVSGDTAVVTAIFGDGAASVSGCAVIFERSGGIWTETQLIAPADGATSDWFGRSVAIEGDTLVIGAPQDDDLGAESGSAYVFRKIAGAWTQVAKLTASDGGASDNFGQGIALSGDTIVVGAPYEDAVIGNSGAAYVFVNAGGVWAEQAKLKAFDAGSSDNLGYAVAVSGDTVLAGAFRAPIQGTLTDAGAAYIFQRTGGSWAAGDKLQPAAISADDNFGWEVALDGHRAVVSARMNSSALGRAHSYRFNGVSWVEDDTLLASDGLAGDELSMSLDLDGNRVVLGAYGHDTPASGAGAAYLYDLFRLDLAPNPPVAGSAVALTLSGANPGQPCWMAYSLAGPGSTWIAPLGVAVQMTAPTQLGSSVIADPSGTAGWSVPVPLSVSGVTVWLQGLQVGAVSNLREVTVL